MYVVKSINTNTGFQWCLLDDNGHLVELPNRFLKHLSNVGKSSYTLKGYAYGLKFFSEFLENENIKYTDVGMNNFFEFLVWLQDPSIGTNVRNIKESKPLRAPRTVNTYMAAVMSFYRYLFKMDLISTNFDKEYLYEGTYTGTNSRYKDFLYHTHKDKNSVHSVFHVKEPRKAVDVLTPKEVQQVITSTTNIRDKFLVYLLFVSGLRIGELLSLYNEDIIFDHKEGHRIRLKDRGLLSNGGKLKTGERTIYINQECMDLYDDYQYEMLDRFDKNSDFLFVKIKGENVGDGMTYEDVMSLFRRLSEKTGLHLYPHLFRHTHATIYYSKTKDPKQLQERLGHRDIQTTLNTYVHPTPEDILHSWEAAVDSFKIGE